jgi:hypothetical protein
MTLQKLIGFASDSSSTRTRCASIHDIAAKRSHRKNLWKPSREEQPARNITAEKPASFRLAMEKHRACLARDIFQPCRRKSQMIPASFNTATENSGKPASFSTANENHRKRPLLALPWKTAETGILPHSHRKT